MSDCLFDLFAMAIRALTWWEAPSKGTTILLAKEIIVALFVESVLRLLGLCIRAFLDVKFTFTPDISSNIFDKDQANCWR